MPKRDIKELSWSFKCDWQGIAFREKFPKANSIWLIGYRIIGSKDKVKFLHPAGADIGYTGFLSQIIYFWYPNVIPPSCESYAWDDNQLAQVVTRQTANISRG